MDGVDLSYIVSVLCVTKKALLLDREGHPRGRPVKQRMHNIREDMRNQQQIELKKSNKSADHIQRDRH